MINWHVFVFVVWQTIIFSDHLNSLDSANEKSTELLKVEFNLADNCRTIFATFHLEKSINHSDHCWMPSYWHQAIMDTIFSLYSHEIDQFHFDFICR